MFIFPLWYKDGVVISSMYFNPCPAGSNNLTQPLVTVTQSDYLNSKQCSSRSRGLSLEIHLKPSDDQSHSLRSSLT